MSKGLLCLKGRTSGSIRIVVLVIYRLSSVSYLLTSHYSFTNFDSTYFNHYVFNYYGDDKDRNQLRVC